MPDRSVTRPIATHNVADMCSTRSSTLPPKLTVLPFSVVSPPPTKVVSDKGRQATLTVNGINIANIIIPEKVEGESNGFFDVEYPLPATLLRDKHGKATAKFLVRLSADGTTPNPGWYGLRLVRIKKIAKM